MDAISLINNTSVYRNPAPQSPLQGPNVMQPAAVYSKIMLKTIELTEADFVFDGLAEERLMPSNNGSNEIVFKRMLALAAHTIPLAEGIPPASDQGRMVAIKASTKSYGRVMKFTDKVNWAVVDPLISEYTRQLSLKVPETKDILAQEALLAECQVFYATEKMIEDTDSDIIVAKPFGDVTHIKYLTPDCSPSIDEFRKIVLSQEAAKVRPYQGSNFLVLASPAVLYDLITDKRVKEFMKYTNTGTAYSNDMVIDLFSLAFKKAKTIKTDNTYTDGNGDLIYIYHAPAYTVAENTTSAANLLSKVDLSQAEATDSLTITVVPLDRDSDTGEYLYDETTFTGTLSQLATACNGTYDVLNVHHSFVLGEECLYRIGVEGHSSPEFITKPLGSAGTEDPLNQRQSIGWKLDAIGYKVPNPDAVVDYMSIPTQYRVNVNARPDFKNQFTDYYYGYVDANGNYYHPEQVAQSVVWNGSANVVKYFVKGTTTEVNAVKMTKLVKPVAAGRTGADGKRPVVTGNVPTMQFALVSNMSIRFLKDQVAATAYAAKAGHYYIKGFEGDASHAPTDAAEVVALPAFNNTGITVPTSDGQGFENRKELIDGGNVNATGDPTVDKE